MNLSKKPETVKVGALHYIYVEKIGPFQETAMAAWGEIHQILKTPLSGLKKTGAMSLFKMDPEMIYRAGFVFDKAPQEVPKGAKYVKFDGGSYSKFTLKGSYMNLGPAWGQVMEMMEEQSINVSDNFFMENYVNDPATTKEDDLISELMIPIE